MHYFIYPVENSENPWLLIIEKAPSKEKLSSFINYFANQSMNNSKLPFEMWNVHGQRHREKNTVGHNSKLKRGVRMIKQNVYILVQTLKDMSESVPFVFLSLFLKETGIKRRKEHVKK